VVAAAPVPPPAEEKKPEYKITTGFGIRYGMQLQNPRYGKEMNTLSVDEIYAEPRFSGQVLGFVGWTANLAVMGNTASTAIGKGAAVPPPMGAPVIFEARAMDLIAQLDFMDEFHVWGGRMLTPSDRSNFSGPWFISAWDYPGVYNIPGRGGSFAYIGPRGTEEIGREVGTTVWGDIGKGKFKYYAAILDLDDAPQNTPLYSARLGYAILGNEPGFYGSSTYYGGQDIVALGVAAQYQARFAPAGLPANKGPDDLAEINADLLAEFKVGDGGAVTGEGAYYHVDSGKSAGVMPFDDAWFLLASYLTPLMGPGKIQPLFRYQGYTDKYTGGKTNGTIIEGYVNYVLKDYFAKLCLGVQHTEVKSGGVKAYGNALQFGFQIQQ